MALLEIEDLEICYHRTTVVEHLSMSVKEKEILAVVGESGSGKSSLLKASMGLLGRGGAVTAGDIQYRGCSVLQAKKEEQRKLRGSEMGMIFQNTGASFCPIRTIESQLYESVRAHEKVSRQEIKDRALMLFEKMKLADGERILKSYPFELSGGMNQRVGIMMAMILKPRLLFADEPTSALDVTVRAQVVNELIQLREQMGTAIVIVTHNIGVAERMADNIAVMHRGQLVEYGSTEQILHEPQQEYTKNLINARMQLVIS